MTWMKNEKGQVLKVKEKIKGLPKIHVIVGQNHA